MFPKVSQNACLCGISEVSLPPTLQFFLQLSFVVMMLIPQMLLLNLRPSL